MFKTLDSILQADSRYEIMYVLEEASGAIRQMVVGDHYDRLAPLALSKSVPGDIAEQFDVARNVFLYSWFVFEFATVAEQQAYMVLEMALRRRLQIGGEKRSLKSLKDLIAKAVQRQWLRAEDFETVTFTPGAEVCELDIIVKLRNNLAHGKPHLMQDGSFDSLCLCHKIIQHLFKS